MKENNLEIDQYQIRCEEWRLKALESDFKERYQALKLPGYDEKMLPIKYFGVDYLIDRTDARLYEATNRDKEIRGGKRIKQNSLRKKKNKRKK
jgi:hypothetical protein